MLNIIQRHYMKEFFKALAVMAGGLALIITLLDFAKAADQLAARNPGGAALLTYALMRYPYFLMSVLPMMTLMAALLTLSMAVRNREVIAVVSAGGRLKAVLAPFIVLGALMSIAAFLMNDYVVPAASGRAMEIREQYAGGPPSAASSSKGPRGATWLRGGGGSLARIDLYVPEADAFQGVTIYRVGQRRIDEVITAEAGAYLSEQDGWLLKGVTRVDTSTGLRSEVKELYYKDLPQPSVLRQRVRKAHEMSTSELAKYSKRLSEAGFENRKLRVELHAKAAQPLVVMLMLVIGVCFGVQRELEGLKAAALGILFSVAFWVGFMYCQSLGYASILSPLVAAWLMPLAAGLVAAYYYNRIPE